MRCRAAPKLRDIVALLNKVFAGPIGAEFAHVSDTDERLWLQDQFMQGRLQQKFTQRRAHQHPAGSSPPPKASSATCTPSTSARSASRSKAAMR